MTLFSKLLLDLRQGQADIDITTAMKEVVEAVRATGKAGKISVTITVAPLNKGDAGQVTVSDSVKMTKPSLSAGLTIMFTTDTADLTRRDPRQMELGGLREVARIGKVEEGVKNG